MEKSKLRERVEEMVLARKVGVVAVDPQEKEISDLEDLLAIQTHVMSELSQARGNTLLKLLKMKGEI